MGCKVLQLLDTGGLAIDEKGHNIFTAMGDELLVKLLFKVGVKCLARFCRVFMFCNSFEFECLSALTPVKLWL